MESPDIFKTLPYFSCLLFILLVRKGFSSSGHGDDWTHDTHHWANEMGNSWLLPSTHSLGQTVSHHSGPSGFVPCTVGGRFINSIRISSVQSLSHVQLFATPWTAAKQASLSFTNFLSLLRLMSIKLVMPSNHLILCCPLLLLPSIFPSIRVFSKESVLHIRWLNYWNFNFSLSPPNEYSGPISSRTDWFDLLSVQGTLKSLFSNTTVQKYKFFSDQLSL